MMRHYTGANMKTFLFGIAIAGLVAVPLACNPFAPDQSVELSVTKLDAPATISSGSSFTVVLGVTTGGCLSFDHITVERTLSSASMTAWGHDLAKGDKNIMCPQIILNEPHSYQFDPPFLNPFTVDVPRGRLSPLTATVQIQ
jgi:hypothetical protein